MEKVLLVYMQYFYYHKNFNLKKEMKMYSKPAYLELSLLQIIFHLFDFHQDHFFTKVFTYSLHRKLSCTQTLLFSLGAIYLLNCIWKGFDYPIKALWVLSDHKYGPNLFVLMRPRQSLRGIFHFLFCCLKLNVDFFASW